MFEQQLTTASYARHVDERTLALRLYRRATILGALSRAFARLAGRPTALRTIPAAPAGRGLGLRAVPLAEIVGSEGRSGDFDARFAPLQEHSRDRWLNVAAARLRGAPLPPVSLVRAGGGYYVRDGNHRVSVAYALGEAFIEAEVVLSDE